MFTLSPITIAKNITMRSHHFIIVIPHLLSHVDLILLSVVYWWPVMWHFVIWWRQGIDLLSELHALCEENLPITDELPHSHTHTQTAIWSFDIFGWWCERTCRCDATIINIASCTLFYFGINVIVPASICCILWNGTYSDTLLKSVRCAYLETLTCWC